MFSTPRKLCHAIEAMVFIAKQQAKSPVSSKDIVQAYDLPPRYLEQMLQGMVRAELLRGVRGPKGGYLLARERRRITLLHIYEVVEDCNKLGGGDVQKIGPASRVMHGLWVSSQQFLRQSMAEVTLEELCEDEEAMKLTDEVITQYTI